eukprot:TRINITY_DN4968_c0_g1_i1.p3 TRINITY_DN4968_c0_g1~~TRINITY_DN4968_c0_g1_i1.p3  ORF type:complete len:72 (+),score=26.49 TRINITY_DN4968_c0_g1_i1:288-503(+)
MAYFSYILVERPCMNLEGACMKRLKRGRSKVINEHAKQLVLEEQLAVSTQRKKKKYRLRGRSSETAKAHRG